MGSFGDFYNKKQKKLSKEAVARKASKSSPSYFSYVPPRPEVIKKGKRPTF